MSFTRFPCPSCKVVLRIAASTPANTPIRCPKCGERLLTPAPTEDSGQGITSAEVTAAPRAPRSPTPAPEDESALLRKISRPVSSSRTVLWVVLGSMAGGFLLLLAAVGIGWVVWMKASSTPPRAQFVPPAGGAPPKVPQAPKERDHADTATEWFTQGNHLMNQGDFDGAIKAFTRAIELNPRLAAAYCNRGLSRSNKGDFDGAIADATKSIELNPRDPFPFINRANARILKGVDPEASIADASRALELRPGIPAALLNLGMARRQKGDYDGAIAEFDKALELLPTFELAYVQRGYTWMQTKKWDKAEADFTSAVELDHGDSGIYQNRGLSRIKQGKRQGAIRDFTIAIQFEPDNATAYFNRGQALFESGNLADADADLEDALRLAPAFVRAHVLRVKILQRRDDRDAALAAAEHLVVLQPKSVEALNCRAFIHAWLGEEEKAMADYAAALKLAPKFVTIHLLRGWIYLSADRADKAAEDADAGLKSAGWKNTQAPYLAILAHCARRRQRADEADRLAAEAMDKAARKGWPQPVLRYLHGDMSAEQLLSAANDNDQRTEAHAYIGVVLWLSGAAEKAREHLVWVRDNGDCDFVEYDLAVLLLSRPEKERKHKP